MKIYFLEQRIITRYPSTWSNGASFETEYKVVSSIVFDGEFVVVRPIEYLTGINDSVFDSFIELKQSLKNSNLGFKLTKLGDL